jgi:hypothetical protein
MSKRLQNNKKEDLFAKGRWLVQEMKRQVESTLTEQEAEDRAAEYINWAIRTKTALSRNGFYTEKGIPQQTFSDQCKRFPVLSYADSIVQGIIADRMYEGAAHINPEQKLTSDALRNFRAFSTDAQKIKEMELKDEIERVKATADETSQHKPGTISLEDPLIKDLFEMIKARNELNAKLDKDQVK